ncbi:CarboxypepD_reg-like domain-containing protein [Flaviramulus basaltis]|uniref:CarboxypepD_reg-like domain-containing protein n=1 Tax=Flaviramulus basaltis TaxID=369401 RepID=A0A1K2IJJ1_9FLAO|nr:carboxypeptidase-like regulatory domain-containing protein [Flaviramulus basaltis]SFZ92462.1 CarboxypepD_reg-like domain-containing protein [Flaviramulus basaltis]
MYKLKSIILIFFPIIMVSQNITGKVYDSQTTVKGATVYNTTKEQLNYTDENGVFEIDANINDTLIFYSLFHSQKTLVVNKNHFKEVLVIELKKTVNELDEVLLNNTKPKPFNEKKQTITLNEQIKNDIKSNPYKYGTQPNGSIDLIAIAGLIGKLFKKKKPKESSIIPISFKQFDSLFTNDTFFNYKLLNKDLKIPNDYKLLFFDYCEAQQIEKKLILKENQFLLLDELLNCSNDFLVILNDYKNNDSLIKN